MGTIRANALQIYKKLEGRDKQGDNNKSGTPLVFLKQPNFRREISGKLFSGSSSCTKRWNRDTLGHRHIAYRKESDPVRTVAAEAIFMKQMSQFCKQGMCLTRQVRYELAGEILVKIGNEKNDGLDNHADTIFGKTSVISNFDDKKSNADWNSTAEKLVNQLLEEQNH